MLLEDRVEDAPKEPEALSYRILPKLGFAVGGLGGYTYTSSMTT